MISETLWTSEVYRETAVLILLFLTVVSVGLFLLRKTSRHFATGWASVKSWFFAAPLILIVMALPEPIPLAFLVLVAIFSSKVFFQMTGMYHRSWFVWTDYVALMGLGYIIYRGYSEFYNVAPMIFLGLIACIPLLRNSPKKMIQYIALSLLAFIFFGWSFLHLGRLLQLEQGVFIILYLYILTEVSENTSLAVTRTFARIRPFSRISVRASLEGLIAALLISLILAWGMRHLLPDRSEQFWIAAGLVAALFGRFGDLILTVIRRDLGIKETGVFIIGRGDILSRVDKLIFVGPLYYYIYIYLQNISLS